MNESRTRQVNRKWQWAMAQHSVWKASDIIRGEERDESGLLAIVLSCESFLAVWIFTDVWSFFRVRSKVTSEVESTGEGASTAWDGAYEVGLVSPSGSAGCLCG